MSSPVIVTQDVDVCQVVFDALSPTLPESTKQLEAALGIIDDRLTAAEYDTIWAAAMHTMCYAQEAAFKLGWQLRGQL